MSSAFPDFVHHFLPLPPLAKPLHSLFPLCSQSVYAEGCGVRRVSCIGEIFCHSMFPEEGRRSVRSARSKSAGNRLACLPACLPGPACLPSWGIALPYSSNPEPDAGWLDNARYLLDCYDSIQLLLPVGIVSVMHEFGVLSKWLQVLFLLSNKKTCIGVSLLDFLFGLCPPPRRLIRIQHSVNQSAPQTGRLDTASQRKRLACACVILECAMPHLMRVRVRTRWHLGTG